MHIHKATMLALGLICCTAAACSLPLAAPTATPIILPSPTLAPPTAVPLTPTPLLPTLAADSTAAAGTQVVVTQGAVTRAVPAAAATEVPPAVFCADAQATALIDSFKSALQASSGSKLASVVSPTHGMEARLYRNGRVVTYDQQHAKFLFESTFSVNWGAAPGSGLATNGPFHETILPDLLDVFSKDYTLNCNEVKVGGTTYQAAWPYTGINFYSVYYPGTAANSNMDWHTWLLGMKYANGRPYLYAIMQFKWEP